MEWIIMNDELMHEGKPGMRWGINKYQTKSGKWTPLGLKRRREREGFGGKKKATPSSDAQKRAANKNEIKNLKSKSELESAKTDYKVSKYENKKRMIDAKNGTIASKLANKVKEDKEARAATKKEKTAEEIIRSGDMKTVLKNKEKLTNEDLAKAIDRMKLDQGLSSVSAAKKQQGIDAYRRVADVVGITANLTTQGINAYNNIAKIMNTVGGKDMKIIGGEKGPSAYDQAMNALKLRQARANADLTEMRLDQIRNAGQNQNSSSSSSSSSQSGTSSSTSNSSSQQTGTSSSTSSSSSSQTGTHTTASQRSQASPGTFRHIRDSYAQLPETENRSTRALRNVNQRSEELELARTRVREEFGVNSDQYERVNRAANAMNEVRDLVGLRYRTRMNSTGLSDAALSNAEREVDRLMSNARRNGVYNDITAANDILQRYLDEEN